MRTQFPTIFETLSLKIKMGHNLLKKMVAEAIPFKIRNDFKTILRTSFVRFKQKGNNVLFWKLNQDSKPLDLKSPYF